MTMVPVALEEIVAGHGARQSTTPISYLEPWAQTAGGKVEPPV